MEHHSLFRFILALIAAIDNSEVTSAPISDLELGRRTVWQNVGRHSFYGPWNIAVKRNGDYIDYNDYDAHFEQFRPNSPELSYSDVSIANGYIDASPWAYDSGLSELNTLLSTVGLADFRTGIRPANWIEQSTDSFKEQHWQDITSQEVEDTEKLDDLVTPIATR